MRNLLLIQLFLFIISLAAQTELNFVEIGSGFNSPTALRAPADGSQRLFVCEKAGRIKILNLSTNEVQAENFLDMSFRVSTVSERGLLGLAFHPDFATNGQFYLHYSVAAGLGFEEGSNIISRFTLNDPLDVVAEIATEEIIFSTSQDFANHNGGELAFGPDGFLYFSIGDGGSGGDPNDRAQDPFTMMGTIGRIKVDSVVSNLPYDIPTNNPYADGIGGLPEIYSIGWRNPWRFSFDRLTGDLWVADVGQDAREEINFTAAGTGAGLNYGWDCREGDLPFSNSSDACDPNGNYVEPIVALAHNSSTMQANSITGGYVYRGNQWPELYGTYICADFLTNNFFSIKPDSLGGWDVFTQPQQTIGGIATFGESEDGEIYAASYFNGNIFQITGGLNTTNYLEGDLDFEVAVFPNPARKAFNIRFDDLSGDRIIKLRLVDQQGRSMLQQTLSLGSGTTSQQIRLPELPAGVYQLMLSSSRGGKVLPLLIKP